VINWFEKRLGRIVETVDSPKKKEKIREELARV